MYYFKKGYDANGEINLRNNYFIELKKILATILAPKTEIIFMNPHGRVVDESRFKHEKKDKQQLTIINWGYHNDYKEDVYKGSLEKLGLCNDGVFVPVASDTETMFIEETQQTPLASFDSVNCRIYLLWDAFHKGSRGELNMLQQIFSSFASAFKELPLFKHNAEDEKIIKYDKTVKFNESVFIPRIKALDKQYKTIQASINDYRKHLAERLASLKTTVAELNSLKEVGSIPPREINNKWVRHIESTVEGFNVYTEPLYVTYIDKNYFSRLVDKNNDYKKYKSLLPEIMAGLGTEYAWYIGQFNIKIDLVNEWSIRFLNQDNRRKGYWESGSDNEQCHHPHVSTTGQGCLGSLSELIASTQANFEIDGLIDVLIQYLQSANLEDPAGYRLYEWDLINLKTGKDALTGKKHEVNLVKIDIMNHIVDLADDEEMDEDEDEDDGDGFECPDDGNCDNCPHRNNCDSSDYENEDDNE